MCDGPLIYTDMIGGVMPSSDRPLNSFRDAPYKYRDQTAGLLADLRHATQKNLCVSTHCTTCGGLPFATTVVSTLRRLGYELPPLGTPREANAVVSNPMTQRAVLAELRKIVQPDIGNFDLSPAVRYLIYRAYSVLPESEVESALGGSWAGQVYQSMRDHHASIQERKLNMYQEQQAQKRRNADRRLLEAELRAERKRERDMRWRQGGMKLATGQ
jgi:hypothetical protein